MLILAGIQEGTLPFPEVEVLAGDLFQGRIVLLDKLILLWARHHHVVAGNDQERVLSADGTGAEMVFGRALIKSSSPLPNALETEGVVAAVQNAELLPTRQHSFQTDLALLIILLYVRSFLHTIREVARVATTRVHIVTSVPVLAVPPHKVLTDDLLLIFIEEVLNQLVLVKVDQVLLEVHFSAANRPDHLVRFIVIRVQDDLLVLLPVFQFLVVLEDVWPVVFRAAILQKLLKVVQKGDLVIR